MTTRTARHQHPPHTTPPPPEYEYESGEEAYEYGSEEEEGEEENDDEIEIENAGWESAEGLPALRQCPDVGPFPVVMELGAWQKMPAEIDLFDAKGDPHAFEVQQTDKHGNRVYAQARPAAAAKAAARESTEHRTNDAGRSSPSTTYRLSYAPTR